jgi:hypothetical protein
MGAILGGCFTFVSLVFLLAFCVQFPAIFWGIVAVFVTAIVLGLREGFRQKREREAGGRGPGFLKAVPDLPDDEGDIRHHYGYDGTPHSISSPETIQNESTSFGDEDDEHL